MPSQRGMAVSFDRALVDCIMGPSLEVGCWAFKFVRASRMV